MRGGVQHRGIGHPVEVRCRLGVADRILLGHQLFAVLLGGQRLRAVEVLLQGLRIVGQHVRHDLRALSGDLGSGHICGVVTLEYHRIRDAGDGHTQHGRGNEHSQRLLPDVLRCFSRQRRANLGARQQVCEGPDTSVTQRPEPAGENRQGVEQVRQIPQQQPHRPDGSTRPGPHHLDSGERTAQAPPGDHRQQHPVDRGRQDHRSGQDHGQPPPESTGRQAHRRHRGRRRRNGTRQQVDAQGEGTGPPGRHRFGACVNDRLGSLRLDPRSLRVGLRCLRGGLLDLRLGHLATWSSLAIRYWPSSRIIWARSR